MPKNCRMSSSPNKKYCREKGKRLGVMENSPNVRTIQPAGDDVIQTTRKESGEWYSNACIMKVKKRARHNDLILMHKDGGLPEAGLDDGGTAEFSGLKSTRAVISNIQQCEGHAKSLTSFSLSNIWTVVSQSTQASVMLTPYLSPEGPNEKCVNIKE